MSVMLTSPDDFQWLLEGHLKGCTVPPFTVAEIHGNEDWPERITLYEFDHIGSLTMDLTPDEDGNFRANRPRF